MKYALPFFTVLVTFALTAQAERLTPTPEAGLWRTESRVLINHPSFVSQHDTQQLAELPTAAYRALLDSAVVETTPDIVMECIPAHEAAALAHVLTLQQVIQRKLPECELDLHRVDRSSLKLSGNCQNAQGVNGALHGLVEFVSSHEIHLSILSNDSSDKADSDVSTIPNLANAQRHEIHRWTSHDCGHIQPPTRLSF